MDVKVEIRSYGSLESLPHQVGWYRVGFLEEGSKEASKVEESGKGRNKRGITWDNTNPLTAGNLTEPDQRVDFVLVAQPPGASAGGALLPSRCAVVLDEPPCDSDHYGVLATLRWSQ